jgi:ATP-binding cassette subfamily C protein
VDDKNIAHNIREWQSVIGYVPQSIFLLDSTIRANIAFGVEDKEIDDRHLEYVIRQAQLHDFVCQLPEGLDTVVGERGIRLSGGQRQRIAIARALYRKPRVLVFDEATAALDNATEREIMSAVENLDKELTVLMIAHRLTTVEKCDAIYVMDNGKIHSHGRYEELLRSSDIFIQLANENTPYTISKS